MNGVHDLGGMHGFGPINPEPNEPVFHHDWERRVFGVGIAGFGGGYYNSDQLRHAMERMGAVAYLSTSYYEHWLSMLETLLIESGVITKEELDARREQLSSGAT
jgi:nitrile hydratase